MTAASNGSRSFFVCSFANRRLILFLPIIGISIVSLGLLKLGSLMVWVLVFAVALKVCIALIVLLAGLLGWSHYKKTP
jgi:hypothetical protein